MYEKTGNPYRFKYLKTGITGPGITEVFLPEWSDDSKILFKKEQKFVKPVMSEQLKEWVDEADFERNKKDKDGNYYNLDYIHPHQREINEWVDMQENDYKIKADELHKRKIDLCDEVFVLNVGGYIGESTRSEIEYALKIGKSVKYLE